MDEEPISYSTLHQDSQQRHTRKNNVKHKFGPNELPLTKKELKHQKPCNTQHRNIAEDVNDTASSKQSPLIIQQKEKLCLGPHHSCPKNWVWFRCNCYYISKEELTWKDSQRACSSLNSSLIRINREEMHFFSLKYFFWIGVYYNGIDRHWLWENDSLLPSDMFDLPTPQSLQACLSYRSREAYESESCERKQNYICKNHLIYSINSQER
ncbi:natural killer cells antigen CD94 isoform X3 [Sus scrofa]|uniref:Natural killer cells antigen CD94 isoform 2 n=1 Tax=Sus scrofa TaxID=9823 RepID=A0A287AGW7_PIG|nr:natural killer cells antigen CD94 isoform X3 [Sus scrofa]